MSRGIRKTRGSSGPPVVEIVGERNAVSTAVSDTHFFGNIDVGTSHATKKVHCLITSEDGNAYVVTGVTVGGIALAKKVSIHLGSVTDELNAEIWAADISSKTGDQAIQVEFGGNVDAVGCSTVATHFMESLTPVDTAVYSSDDSWAGILTDLAGPAGGIVFAVAGHASINATASWSSMTEKVDIATGPSDGFDLRHTAAWDLGERAASTETITWSLFQDNIAAGASFR